MLGLGSYAGDGEQDDDESDESGEEEEEEDEDEDEEDEFEFNEEYEDGGITNIYPGTGDADVDGVGQHSGTQIKIDGMTWGGCSVAQFATVRVLVSCLRCTHDEEAAVSRHRSFESECKKCSKEVRIRLRPDVLHSNNSSAGYLDIEGAKASQILPSDFWVACSDCGAETKFTGARAGTRGSEPCRTCYAALAFGFTGARLEEVRVAASKVASAGRSTARDAAGKKVKMTMPDGLLEGTPLPDQGACKHFRRSRRWLCFPCCGRSYPCPACHDEKVAGEHVAEWATRMICGYCSREQVLSNKLCISCGADPSGTSSCPGAHWAGGEGMRDRTQLDKKDSRHISGHDYVKKTTSKKKSRVGEAGKQAREKKKLAKAKPSV